MYDAVVKTVKTALPKRRDVEKDDVFMVCRAYGWSLPCGRILLYSWKNQKSSVKNKNNVFNHLKVGKICRRKI
jgi:hypothetical protein